MKNKMLTILIFVSISCVPVCVLAQGWGWNSNYNRLYNVDTETTITGTIKEIIKFSITEDCPFGIALEVNTEGDVKTVNLGPDWYLDNQDIKLSIGEEVKVVGSVIKYDNEDIIIAREIVREDDVLLLRDKDGFPYWAGWRRR